MTIKYSLAVALLAVLLASCAQMRELRGNVAGNEYLDCLNSAADEYMSSPTGADQIATAAHARCWSEWSAYRERIAHEYTVRARSPEELQLGRDKADAYLRQFEADARKAVMTRVVQRTYGVEPAR